MSRFHDMLVANRKGAIAVAFALLIGYMIMMSADSGFNGSFTSKPVGAEDFSTVMGQTVVSRDLEKIYFHNTPPPPFRAVHLTKVLDVNDAHEKVRKHREREEARARGEKVSLDEDDGDKRHETLADMVLKDDHVFGTHWHMESKEATERRAEEQMEYNRVSICVKNISSWWDEEYEKLRGYYQLTANMPQAPPAPGSPPPAPKHLPKELSMDEIKSRVADFLEGVPPAPIAPPPSAPPPPPYLEEEEKVASSAALVTQAETLERQWNTEKPVLQRLMAKLKQYVTKHGLDDQKLQAIFAFAEKIESDKEDMRKNLVRIWDQMDRIYNYFEMQLESFREKFHKAVGTPQFPTWEDEVKKIKELAAGNNPLLMPLLRSLTDDSDRRLGVMQDTERACRELPLRGNAITDLFRSVIPLYDDLKRAHDSLGDGARGLTAHKWAQAAWMEELKGYSDQLDELPKASNYVGTVLQLAHKMSEEERAHMQLSGLEGGEGIWATPEALELRQKALDEMSLKLKVLRQQGTDVQHMAHELSRMERGKPREQDIDANNAACALANKILRELPMKMDVVNAGVSEMYAALKLEDKAENVYRARIEDDGKLMG